jgi:hypothetical protein
VFNTPKTTDEVCDWLTLFQKEVDALTESQHLQFTVDIWNPNSPPDEVPQLKAVKICRKKQFPYLDTELFWREKI